MPHAGELGPPEAIRDALDLLHADRLRHGIRAIEDPDLVQELKERGTVLDVCPVSNVRVGVVPSMEEHPLPKLVEAGVLCSLSTDDPPMFDTDPHEGVRSGVLARAPAEGLLRSRGRGRALRRADEGAPRRHWRRVRLVRARRPAGGARLALLRLFVERGNGSLVERIRPSGLSSTAVSPVRPHSPRALIMWKTMPVCRD